MIFYKTWIHTHMEYRQIKSQKKYKMILLFGFIPLFVWIDEKK